MEEQLSEFMDANILSLEEEEEARQKSRFSSRCCESGQPGPAAAFGARVSTPQSTRVARTSARLP
eukprot:5544705-Lingulodinium_polyedra.AAC.1